MTTAIIVLFVLGYLAIALEHPLKLDKAATALLLGVVLWTVYALNPGPFLTEATVPEWFRIQQGDHAASPAEPVSHADGEDAPTIAATPVEPRGGLTPSARQEDERIANGTGDTPDANDSHPDLVRHYLVDGQLLHQLSEIAGILFFLMGAMTIVEMIDAFEGFSVITNRIGTRNKVKLLWMIGWLTFFMSSVLDNLTTTIVMVSLLKKLIKDRDTRLVFVGIVVIAANSGGAWTVIGDVTTTMLWIKAKISPLHVMTWVFLPSVASLLVPLIGASFFMKGPLESPDAADDLARKEIRPFHRTLFFLLGFAGLLSVPIFKTVTHLPPFMGMMLALAVMWMVADFVRKDVHESARSSTHVVEILRRIDVSSILFFLGILLAIGALSATGILDQIAQRLRDTGASMEVIAIVIGLVSAIVDNVPLVAAGIEMYEFPMDDPFWTFLAFCAGTGGSCLIIGSAAGVAAMGLDKIDFLWYLRRITPLAVAGYFAGVGVYLLQEAITGHRSGVSWGEFLQSFFG